MRQPRFLLRLAVIVLSTAFNATTNAEPFKEGQSAYKTKEYTKALVAFRTAAGQGNASAQFFLGLMYFKGYGVTPDATQALSWYRKAAEQGHADAQYNLGWMYGFGQGATQDDAQSAYWYRKAAEQGHVTAQYFLGMMYEQGQGLAQDEVQAYKWLTLCAASGNKDAMKWRDLVAAKMTTDQITTAQKLVHEWTPAKNQGKKFQPNRDDNVLH